MRLALLCALVGVVCALAPTLAPAQTAPRFHGSSSSSSSSSSVTVRYVPYRPLWEFRYYPRGIPKSYDPKTPGYRYYPYLPYRTDYPRDHYDRNKSQRYPVR